MYFPQTERFLESEWHSTVMEVTVSFPQKKTFEIWFSNDPLTREFFLRKCTYIHMYIYKCMLKGL